MTDSNGTGPARFIFDTEAGTIAAWRSGTTAVTTVTTANAVYKGLGIGAVGASSFLYAVMFRTGTVAVFGPSFPPVGFAPGTFVDPAIPAGYAPFNIQNLGGKIYVTYALQNAAKHDDVPGPGNGFVNVFNTTGQLQQRLISNGHLHSPWGLVIAPAIFGFF